MSPPLRDPVRLALSWEPWAAAWYLFVYLFTGTILFAVALSAAITGAVLGLTLAGLPVLVAAAAVIKWCANAERARLRIVDPRPVRGQYHRAAGPGLMAQLRTRWSDPSIWRDLAYLVGLYVPLLTLDVIVWTVWLYFLAGILLPIWYWAPSDTFGNGASAHGVQLGYFPNGPHGHPGYGFYVDTFPKAVLAAVVFLILFLLFNYVLVATARRHAAIARRLLGPRHDPLREAREVLSQPGPLQRPLSPTSRHREHLPASSPAREGPAHGRGPRRGQHTSPAPTAS